MATTNTVERRLTRREAANFLNGRGYVVAVTTLGKYATVGGGPPYEKFGRKPLYTESGLLNWVAGRTKPGLKHSSDHGQQLAA